MHAKDLYLALILCLAIAHSTYEWIHALGVGDPVTSAADKACAKWESGQGR